MRFKAIIFDMDGVLIDSEPLHKQVEQQMLHELGVDLPHEEHITFAGSGKEMWTAIKNKYGFNRETNEDELHILKRQRYLKELTSKPIRPISGVQDVVNFAKENGIDIAVASSSSRENIELVTKAIGIFDDLKVVVSGDEMPRTKPDPAIFIKTGELLGYTPNECIVIEDSGNGVKAAKRANMYCLAFKNPNSGNQDLAPADAVTTSLLDAVKYLQ